MRQVKTVLGLFCVILLSSCSDSSSRGITTPTGLLPTAQTNFSKDKSGAEPSVTGQGEYILANIDNVRQSLQNNAIVHANGAVSGEFHIHNNFDGGQRARGRIVCVGIVGNRANVAGVIEQSSTPVAPVGNYLLWSVVDNGEGHKDAPDMVSNVFEFTDRSVALAHCAHPIDVGTLFPVEHGNYQVRSE